VNGFVITDRRDQARLRTNAEILMTNDELNPNDETRNGSLIVSR